MSDIRAREVPIRNEVGLLTANPTTMLLAQCRLASMDFVILDAEDSGLTVQDCANFVASFAGRGPSVGIRVPNLRAQTLLEFSNTGADELILPQVRTMAEIELAYRVTRFPPVGERPRQASLASGYGTYFTHAPRLTVLIETVDAVNAAAAFAQSELIAGAMIGPTDLADDYAREGAEENGSLDSIIDEIITVFRSADRNIGLPASDNAGISRVFDRGANRCAVYWEKSVRSTLNSFVAARRH